MPYSTTGEVLKKARYRWNYEIRKTPDSNNDYTSVFSLVGAASSSGTPGYVANMENMANMENWMRVFAANHAAGCGDAFGSSHSQNLYGYIGTQGTKYTLLMWELENVFGNSYSMNPGQDLLSYDPDDSNMGHIYSNPTFMRMYWRAIEELLNGPLNVANGSPLLLAKYNAFRENGLNVENPADNIEPWLSQAQSSIASQLAAVNAGSFSVNSNPTIANNVASVSGGAPVDVDYVVVNGVAYPLTWSSLTNWTLTVPLTNGINDLSIVGIGHNGQPMAAASNQLTVNYAQTVPSAVGHVVINEIMYAPSVPGAEYLELFNNSPGTTYDLSGWRLSALSYTFSPGSLLPPLGYLVLTSNRAAFAAAYGATTPVFDTFSSPLTPGLLLSLTQPIGGESNAVAQVQFDNVSPWPVDADVAGVSLQLIDSQQDNWRAGNWETGQTGSVPLPFTPDAANSVAASLPPFAPLWINEIEPNNVTGTTNSVGRHAPWVELYNPSTNAVALTNLYLTDDYSDLTNWSFPSGAAINPGQFLVIFSDGRTNLSTLSELHASFALNSSNGSVALSRLFNGQPQVLDYVNYSNLQSDWSYGSMPDGQSFVRTAFYSPTPGSANGDIGVHPASFIDYGTDSSVYTQNFDSLPDPGTASVNTANPVTIDGATYSLANPYDFAFPAITNASAGGLGLPELAGWYGSSALLSRFGATDGDQTTGGQISFGLPGSSNRALGLLATSTTGATAIGAKFMNTTGSTLNFISVGVTGGVWRQSNLPKTLQCSYAIDPTAVAPMPGQATGSLPELNVEFPTISADLGGVAVDGTAAGDQVRLATIGHAITAWPSGAALWLIWEMPDSTGKAQGLAIDNLSFAASASPPSTNAPVLNFQSSSANPCQISWPASAIGYQLYSTTNLSPPVNWSLVAAPVTENNGTFYLTILPTNASQFFCLAISSN